MDDFGNRGFLSKEIESWIKKIRKEKSEIYKLCDALNIICQKTIYLLKVQSNILEEVLVTTLFFRAVSNFQSIVLLSERGLINESKIVLRCMLEAMFALTAVAKDETENISKKLVQKDQVERKKVLKALKRNFSRGGKKTKEEKFRMQNVERIIQEIEHDIQKMEITDLDAEYLAKKAGLSTFYDSAYKYLCGSVHPNVRDLEQYFEKNGNDNIKFLKWEPDISQINLILSTTCESMLIILEGVSKQFLPHFKKERGELYDKLKDIVLETQKP